MVFSRSMKLPIEILYNRLNSPIYCRRDSSSWPCRGRSIAEAGEIINAFTSNNANPHHAYGMFLRRYAALSLAKLALLVESSSQQVSRGFFGGPEYLEELKINLDHPKLSGEKTVQTAIAEVAAIMGENVKLRRTFAMSAPSQGIISAYLHTSPQQGLGRIAGILSLEVEDGNTSLDPLQHVGSELAMHIVAAKPLFLTKDLVSIDALENEHEILKSQAESTGKSQMAIEKMVEGRLRKYYEDVVLMEQKFVVNDDVNVKTLLDNLSKEVGSPVKIGSFCRMEVGEGVQG
ncbi:translation elongation factor Ts [Actinidia rufa]|uniref:Elongation factor Ts, mitochondrial n=1 Tax=Actinidia rufa TaxID=165716 RepID=A0A7J0GNL1_9ERIC|nr:translation elongation factor Ts [Actinidia rufa]